MEICFLDVKEIHSEWNLFTFDNNVTLTGEHQTRRRCKERILLASLVDPACRQASSHIGIGGVAFVAKDPPGAHLDCVGNCLGILELSEFPYALLVEVLQLLHNVFSNGRRI